MFYYLNNKRSDAPAEIQEKIDSAVRNKILPFNWKIDFPVELKNVYMPKAIIQPMVENAFKYSGYKMNELNELGLKVEFKRIANEVEEDTADIEICVSNSIKPETKINLEEVKQKILFGKPNALAHNSLHLIWQRLNYEIKNKSSEDGVLIIPEVRGNKFLLTCKIIGCRFEKRAEHRPTMNLAQKKVLLIEDNAEDVFKTKEIITGEGNRTLKGDIKIERVVNTLNEARDVLKGKHPFNIVIVDLMLSKDGEEDYWTTQIFEELSQENIELAEIGIIFLSGESSKESDVSIFMTKRFPKNYLGFSTKFEDTYDDLDNFLNIYYERFKK
jgi:CheY-like chemotaxis protein